MEKDRRRRGVEERRGEAWEIKEKRKKKFRNVDKLSVVHKS